MKYGSKGRMRVNSILLKNMSSPAIISSGLSSRYFSRGVTKLKYCCQKASLSMLSLPSTNR